MNQELMKRKAEPQNDSELSKRAKIQTEAGIDGVSLDISQINYITPTSQDSDVNCCTDPDRDNPKTDGLGDKVADESNRKSITEIVNDYIKVLKMEKIPETPLYSKLAETGERVIFAEAGFLTIITSKGNRRQTIDFTKINMNEFNKALNEAAFVMIPVSYVYKHAWDPSKASKLNHHQEHMGMIIYRKEEKKIMYVDARLNSETKRVDKDVRVKKVYNIALRFLRKKLKFEGKYRSKKIANPNPMPSDPHIPLLWIVEQTLANPNGPFPDPSQSPDLEEYKKKVNKSLQDQEDNDKDSQSEMDTNEIEISFD